MRHLKTTTDPTALLLIAGDVEVSEGMPSNELSNQMEDLVKEARNVFPWTKIMVSGIPGNKTAIHEVNKSLQAVSQKYRNIVYFSNNTAQLKPDNIHMCEKSKRELCKTVAGYMKRYFH